VGWVGSRGANRPLRDPDGGHNALALCDRTCHLFIQCERGPSKSILKTVNRPTPGNFRIIATQVSSCLFFLILTISFYLFIETQNAMHIL